MSVKRTAKSAPKKAARKTAIAVGTSFGDLYTVPIPYGCTRMIAVVKNTGANAFTGFEVHGKVTPQSGAEDLTLAGVAGDYSGPVYPVLRTVGAPVTLAAGAVAWMVLDCTGFASITLRAKAGTATTAAVDINQG